MACNADSHHFTTADLFSVLGHGLFLDLSTALYVLAIPFLCVAASIWFGWPKLLRWVLNGWFLLVSLTLALAFVADTSLYPFWQFKLDATCLQYLDTPAEAMASVSTGYIILRVAIFALLTTVFFLAYTLPHPRLKASRHRITETLATLACIPLIVIGIRGGLGESTTNIGQVYFSQNQFLNHSAVNPVFSFLASLETTANNIPEYHFLDDEECIHTMQGLYPTKSIDTDTLLNTDRPNVVIILLESCGGVFTEDIGGRSDVMPHFNKLVGEGVYFTQFYANSYRTDRGTLCTWSGFPSFPRSTLMKMPSKTEHLPGIAASLRNQGYSTTYLYGGDINFTNMRSYLINIGFEHLIWQKDYTAEEQHSSEWGVHDHITFRTLEDIIAQQQQPFLIGFSTLSSHEPWDVPTHQLEDPVLNAFNYLDQCIGKFIDAVSQTPEWKNLLVVMLPDHGFSYGEVNEEHPMHDHVPMLWVGGAIKEPRRINLLCNQTDLPATLLGQMGIDHSDFRFSRDVLSKNYVYPFAHHTYNNGVTMKDSTGFAVLDLNANRIVVDQSTDAETLIKKGKAILQTASREIKDMK
ncbi:MAG: sulfatase-like hydrolase/transferase [Prevotella sp.]|nr:sulfatase-like hydrolase/transferase [Prevotella sp.]